MNYAIDKSNLPLGVPMYNDGLFSRDPSEGHATSVRSRFSAEAPTYDGYANIQKKVAERLMNFITVSPKRILEIGCGSGHLTSFLIATFKDTCIEAIDVSPAMIEEASRKKPHNKWLKWRVADILNFSSEHKFDLIMSASALHWIHPIGSVFDRVRLLLAPNGRFISAIMVDGTLRELHDARLRVAPEKPPQGKLIRGEKVREIATQSGFEIIECREELLLESFDSSADFLQAIHRIGVTGGNVSKSRNPLTRSEIIQLMVDYDAHYGDNDGHVVATYNVLYMHLDHSIT